MNAQLDMLTAREQLMEDIDCIITSQYLDDKIDEDDMEDLIRVLCDAVCKNFPVTLKEVAQTPFTADSDRL